jgi:hypothetical protein
VPSTHEWIRKMWYVCAKWNIPSAIENEILLFTVKGIEMKP